MIMDDHHTEAAKNAAKKDASAPEHPGKTSHGLAEVKTEVKILIDKFNAASGDTARFVKKQITEQFTAKEDVISFIDLYRKESKKLGNCTVNEKVEVTIGAGDEPWLSFTSQDRLGLALSGGGIRSATFNLGLLQALDQLGVLKHVDYLATVSGGGYIGGFWTAWLLRRKQAEDAAKSDAAKLEAIMFPASGDRATGETPEVRHLREFSRFLLPCIRLLGAEFWGILMVVLGGMLPSILSALAVLVLMWWGWVTLLACLLADRKSEGRAWLMLAFVALYFIFSERLWRKSRRNRVTADQKTLDSRGHFVGAMVACLLTMVGVYCLRNLVHLLEGHTLSDPLLKTIKVRMTGLTALTDSTVGFGPALVIAGVTLALLELRFLLKKTPEARNSVSFFAGSERAVTQMLRLAAIMMTFAALWWVVVEIERSTHLSSFSASAAFSTGLFLWARKWLSEPPKETHGGGLLHLAFNWLKRATPKVLASLSWLLIFVLVGVGVEWCIERRVTSGFPPNWLLPVLCLVQVGLMIWRFDPTRMSLHELYRARISRCYLGASNPEGILEQDSPATRTEKNRSSNERPGDDLTMDKLAAVERPIHLVCVAANDLSGDPVGTLYRGAQSAVLSCHGISLGNQTAKFEELKFSSALTASAAAFNSQMGRISMGLGPAVTFLMSAFNLRLGLWVPHPKITRRWKTPLGLFFFYELFGVSTTTGRNLLLSDGGHFENFGLYELLRRHCRYIIVSDCGADLEVAFDDLANVLRRVREDFGVEVELDVNRLRSGANGLAAQHAVVGTAHYNGLGGMDKGTILFIKPAITGDEPPDVLQYRTRNTTFPQESTVNQFYDEPQWESYRRLGEHTGRSVLSFLDRPQTEHSGTVDHIFREARSFWHPTPENLDDRFIELSARSAELEENLTSEGPLTLRSEFFSEAAELSKLAEASAQASDQPKPAPSLEEELKVLGFLIRIIQIMEDVWIAGDFERYWSHPLNEGWMSYFHRWADTPSFRRWWPVLAPIYSPGLRAFVQNHFAVGSVDPMLEQGSNRRMTAKLRLTALLPGMDYQKSHAWQSFLQHGGSARADKTILGYELHLLNREGQTDDAGLWVGFVLISEGPKDAPDMAEWHAEDFFVPPMLHGGKIVSNFLDAVIQHYRISPKPQIVKLRVEFGAAPQSFLGASGARNPQGLSPAARYEQVRKIEFYKSRGFQYRQAEEAGVISLYLDLDPKNGSIQPRLAGLE
jgi:hypothetical protein